MIKTEQDIIDYYIEMCYQSVNECIECAKQNIDLPGTETCIWLCTIFIEKCKQFRFHYKNNSGNKIKSLEVCMNACKVCMNQCSIAANESCKELIQACWMWMKECENILKDSTGNLANQSANNCLALAY